MKQNTSSNDLKKGNCVKASCRVCAKCKAANFEERRQEFKTISVQLYAKEVENYFFYYDLRIKQNQ